MSCQKIRKFSHALLQKSKAASLCKVLKTSVASYGNVASRGPTNQIVKCCENGQSCGSNSGIQATGSPATPTSPSPANHRQVAGKNFKEVSPTFSERAFTTAPKIDSKIYLWSRYNEMKRLVHGKMFLCNVKACLMYRILASRSDLLAYSCTRVRQHYCL